MKNSHLIEQVVSLPVEERAILVDLLLQTLNQPESKIDKQWYLLAEKRLKEMKSGKVKGIHGDKVFSKIKEKYNK